MSKPVQRTLYYRKAFIYVLRYYRGYSITEISILLNVGRATLWRFLQTSDWKEFVLSVQGDPVLEEVIRYFNGDDEKVNAFAGANEQTPEDVRAYICEKYPQLTFYFHDSEFSTAVC